MHTHDAMVIGGGQAGPFLAVRLAQSGLKSDAGRAKERGETRGYKKVLVDAQTERILGASRLCIGGDEIVHSLLDVVAAGASYRVV